MLPEPEHSFLVIRRFKLDSPIGPWLHCQGDRVQGGHIHAGPQQKHLFAFCSPAEADILRGGRDDIGEKALVFSVIVGEKATDGIDSFVLGLKK